MERISILGENKNFLGKAARSQQPRAANHIPDPWLKFMAGRN